MDVKRIVEERFSEPQKCYGHCEETATLKFLPGGDDGLTVAGYSCPSSYLSRLIVYGDDINLDRVRAYLQQTLKNGEEIRDEDIRLATRYSWDLGVNPGHDAGKVMRVAYWTQNYRRTKKDDANRMASFLCPNCKSIFTQPLTSKETLCPDCR